MREILAQLLAGVPLSEDQSSSAFELILTGEANESQVGAFLALIAHRGPLCDEIIGGARVMRKHALRLPIERDDPIRETMIDTCGTGGTPKTFNISTASALVAAAARGPDGQRVYVAKHGGRSRSGRGSAEVLEAMGVNVDAGPEVQAACLRELGVCFSFAVNHHPAMKFAAGPRKSLGFATIFNLLGPLTNPAGATRQLLGVYDVQYVPIIAQALFQLGAKRAMVVHGHDGMDEISTTAPTTVAHVDPSGVRIEEFDAESLGVARASLEDLRVKTLQDGVNLIQSILAGNTGPARDIVEVNAAGALVVGGAAADMSQGLVMARHAVDSGEAARTLEKLGSMSSA